VETSERGIPQSLFFRVAIRVLTPFDLSVLQLIHLLDFSGGVKTVEDCVGAVYGEGSECGVFSLR